MYFSCFYALPLCFWYLDDLQVVSCHNFLLHFSHLEEDPLYIAYADMMAKVVSLQSIPSIKSLVRLVKKNEFWKFTLYL